MSIEKIINAGVEIATVSGVAAVTAKAVARVAGVSRQTVHNNFTSSHAMRDEVFRECINRNIYSVIAALVVNKHPIAADISAETRQRALANV